GPQRRGRPPGGRGSAAGTAIATPCIPGKDQGRLAPDRLGPGPLAAPVGPAGDGGTVAARGRAEPRSQRLASRRVYPGGADGGRKARRSPASRRLYAGGADGGHKARRSPPVGFHLAVPEASGRICTAPGRAVPGFFGGIPTMARR